jgi:hypothetical protein
MGSEFGFDRVFQLRNSPELAAAIFFSAAIRVRADIYDRSRLRPFVGDDSADDGKPANLFR